MNTIRLLKHTIRWMDWKDTKIPFYFIYYFTYAYKHIDTLYSQIAEFGIGLIFFSVCMAIGHITNDVTDKDADLRVGKIKVADNFKPLVVFLLLVFFLCTLHYTKNFSSLSIFIGCLLIGVAYSVKPIRFKERGIWGILIGSISQRILPLIPISYYLNISILELLFFFLLCFVVGNRQMLVHQIKDYTDDVTAGVNTYVTTVGLATALRVLKTSTIVLEPLALLLWGLLTPNAMLRVITLLYACFLSVVAYTKSSYWLQKSWLSSTLFFTSDYYFVIAPLTTALTTAYPFCLIATPFVFLWQRYFLKKLFAF